MTALRKALILEEEPVVTTKVARTAPKLYVVTPATPAEAPEVAGNRLANIALFFAAPFLGLAYIILLPFVGIGALALLALREAGKYRALRAVGTALRHAAMIAAAPLVGLAYVVAFPVAALGALAWFATRAAVAANLR